MVKKYFSGFTLVELLIVISIVAILATIAIMYFGPQIFKGNDATRKADIDRIKIAVEEYEKDHNCYPPRAAMENCGTDSSIAVHPYLNNVPCDPVTHIAYYYESSNADDSLCGAWFRLYTVLENKNDTSIIPNIGRLGAFNYVQSSENAPPVVSGSNGTPPPSGSGGNISNSGFYGCFSGVCKPIDWNSAIDAPECAPNYQLPNCSNQCSNPSFECLPQNQK